MKMKDLEWWHWLIIGVVVVGIGVLWFRSSNLYEYCVMIGSKINDYPYCYGFGLNPLPQDVSCQTNQDCMDYYKSCFSVCSGNLCYGTGALQENQIPPVYPDCSFKCKTGYVAQNYKCVSTSAQSECELNGGECVALGDFVQDTCEMHNMRTLSDLNCPRIAVNTQCCMR